MIRRILLASAGVMALAGTAFAADLPSRAPPPAYIPPPPLWTGFYIGINAGYGWGASQNVNIASAPVIAGLVTPPGLLASDLSALAFGTVPAKGNGFIGGGQIGYNYQFANSWVAGLEADIDGVAGARSNGNVATFGTVGPVNITTGLLATKSLDYLGTVRGRIGYLMTPTLLIYGGGGLAYGGVNLTSGVLQYTPAGLAGFGASTSFSNTQVGWTAGGGVEWMFLPNWSAKIEYLYYDLGTVTAAGPLITADQTTAFAVTQNRTHFNGNVVRAGINYHFNWGTPAPVVAKY